MKRMFAAAVAALCATASFTATAEYVRFSQLQSTGAQYVVTNFGMVSNDTIEVKYKTPSSSITRWHGIFCNRKNFSAQSFTHLFNGTSFRIDYGQTLTGENAGQNYSNDNDKPKPSTPYTVNMNGATGQWTINGTVQNHWHTPASFTPAGPLVFFALTSYDDKTSTLSSTNNYAEVVFYYAKIWSSDGTLKHHFVPARDTEQIGTKKEYGLLDIVPDTPVFYTNEGTAAFKVSSSDIVWVGRENAALSESGNWSGDSGSMVFLSDATATLNSDWTAALGNGRMMVKGENQKTTLDLGSGNVLSLTNNFCVAADGASAEIVSGVVTNASDGENFNYIYVGSEAANQSQGFQGCSLAVKNGARFYAGGLYVGYSGKAVECEALVTGEGSLLHSMTNSTVGYYEGSASNRLVVADHAAAVFERTLRVGGQSSRGSALRIESGGSVTCRNAPAIGCNGASASAHSREARVFVTGEGSTWTATYLYVITGTNDVSGADATEVFVGDGGEINCQVLMLAGVGSRLVVSNATVSCTGNGLYTQHASGLQPDNVAFSTNSTIRFVGADAKLTASTLNGGNNNKAFAGSEILEFVIPENGWARAPFQANVAFTIPDGTTLRIDEDSVKAYMKANPRGGTVPLLTTGSANLSITVASMENLAANLPDGCELVNESGVLSVKIPGRTGMTIIFR